MGPVILAQVSTGLTIVLVLLSVAAGGGAVYAALAVVARQKSLPSKMRRGSSS